MKKRQKRWLAAVLAVVLACITVLVWWKNVMDVQGEEALGDFVIENGVLTKYTGEGRDVVIPEGVTSIGTEAFANCTGLTSVIIPEGVTSIGRYGSTFIQS